MTSLPVLVWGAIGVMIVAAGGLMASRARASRAMVATGVALTLAGVALLAAVVWYHASFNPAGY